MENEASEHAGQVTISKNEEGNSIDTDGRRLRDLESERQDTTA